ncbi:DUF4838 domain-containing protein [Paenibacillus sp. GCM10027626]|uniref:DUF4838 domain-containing protein n=1 Tax=Paenibacillus sp. GCM10027626 TaxID=3273411 RepID=UPI003637D532
MRRAYRKLIAAWICLLLLFSLFPTLSSPVPVAAERAALPTISSGAPVTTATYTDSSLPVAVGGQAQAVVLVPPNPAGNGSNVPGWQAVATKANITASNAVSYSGAYSLYINDNDNRAYAMQSDNVAATSGHNYTVSLATYLATGTKPTVYLRFYDASLTLLTQYAMTVGDSGLWKTDAMTKTAPAGTAFAAIRLYCDTAGMRSVYFDDVSFTDAGNVSLPLKNGGFEQFANTGGDRLVEYVRKATGVELPVMTEQGLLASAATYAGYTRIYVGMKPAAGDAHVDAWLANLDSQGFLIHPDGSNIVIIGPTNWGTLNGVSDFLERYVGVRWLMPGPSGEDVPQLTGLSVPADDVREQPAFANRLISPAYGSPDAGGTTQALNLWAQENKLQGLYNRTLEFQENLHQLFKVEDYGVTHPEYYPNGSPPAAGVRSGWQPCFSVPGTVDAAVNGIKAYFAVNPNATSYSLGVNDAGGFCEATPSTPKNSMGFADMSDLYYAWVNDVVGQVLLDYPDKWFGLLAYREVADPPSFPLNARVVPFITKDRMAWIDDTIKTDEQLNMDAWKTVADQLGWYDYMYGSLYLLPRTFNHIMADNLQYAHDSSVAGSYTEMYQNAGDGPKAWLLAKLLWNPDQDVDLLLQEWAERAVGPAAAPDLLAYYDWWEAFWTERIKGSAWFEKRKTNVYLDFVNASYLNLVTEQDMAHSKQLLDNVVAKAASPAQQARANILHQAFDYYALTVDSFPRKTDPVATEAEALDLLDDLQTSIDVRLQDAASRHALMTAFDSEPALRMVLKPSIDWTGWNGFEFADLAGYLAANEPSGGTVTDAVYALANAGTPSNIRNFARLLQVAQQGAATNLMQNPSFESGTTTADSWAPWIEGTGTVARVTGTAYSGSASQRVTGLIAGAKRGGTIQVIPVQAGLTAAQIYYYTPVGTSTGNIQLLLQLRDASGNRLASLQTVRVDLAATAGQWSSIGLLDVVPATVNGKAVVDAQFVVAVDECDDIYLDDAKLHQLAD